MTHTTTLLTRLRAAIPAIPDEYHRTSIRLAIAEIEHMERVGAVRGRMFGDDPTVSRLTPEQIQALIRMRDAISEFAERCPIAGTLPPTEGTQP
jgi:hypothetical protein